MKKWIYSVVCAAAVMSIVGCSASDNKLSSTAKVVEIEDQNSLSVNRVEVQEKRKTIEGDWEFLELVETETPWIYVRNLKAIEEFGKFNEGGATWDAKNNLIRFGFTSVLDETKVEENIYIYAEVDVIKEEVTQKEMVKSGKVHPFDASLSDKRLVEMGKYFSDIIKSNL